ncbi:hypothetical protein FRC07_004567, partial [Ceratobasidium sp. 392]
MSASSIEFCTGSFACILEKTFSAGVPVIVLLLVAARGAGVRVPDSVGLNEFVSYNDVDKANAEGGNLETQLNVPSSPTDELVNELTPLLSDRGVLATQPDVWRQVALVSLAFLQIVGWTTRLIFLAQYAEFFEGYRTVISTAIVALVSWIYAALRPILRLSRTPYYDLFTIYGARIGFNWVLRGCNVLICLAGLVVIAGMPLSVMPNRRVEESSSDSASLEDRCTLWEWITFSWVTSIISLGTSRPLEEKDVWKLSYTMRTRVLMHKFLRLKGRSLLHRLYTANARDILIDISLTCLSTLMNFSAPFFLNLILRAMSAKPMPESSHLVFTPISSHLDFYRSVILDSGFLSNAGRRSSVSEPAMYGTASTARSLQRSDAYFFAFALFLCQLVKAQSELQHLYFSRRATIRIDGELVASVYEKILRHKDVSSANLANKKANPEDVPQSSPSNIDIVDGGIQDFMIQVIRQVAALMVALATIVYVVPLFVIPAILIAGLHLWFARGYTNASRDLRRIESNARSPIMASFSELVTGVVTGALSVFMAITGSLMSGATAGLAGVVIVQAQQFVRGLYMSIRVWTELEQSFNSVERIQEYLELPSEPPTVIESSRPPATWPSTTTGALVVKNLVIKYAPELEPALDGITLEIKPAEKIGIVGRTGSGKSTLALALFRFVDPTQGRIILDGIDITTIGVEDWRSRLTLIPQDATLFNGTMRENLDPFNEYDDATLYDALRRVHLHTSGTIDYSASPTGKKSDGLADSLEHDSNRLDPITPLFESSSSAGAESIAFTLDTK